MTSRGAAISLGLLNKKKNNPAAHDKMIRSRNLTNKYLLESLSQEEREDFRQNRIAGSAGYMKNNRATWRAKQLRGCRTLKTSDKVHRVKVVSTAGPIEGYVRGYEYITIALLDSLFGDEQLVSWQLCNDVFFPVEDGADEGRRQFLMGLQTSTIALPNDQDHDFDHSLILDHASVQRFCEGVRDRLGVDLSMLFPPGIDVLLAIETKSFQNERCWCKCRRKSGCGCNDRTWFREVQKKAVESNGLFVNGRHVVYVLFEWNPSGLVVYAPVGRRLMPLGVALYERTRSIDDFRAYFKKFDEGGPFQEETVSLITTCRAPRWLPWKEPLTNAVENVVTVSNPFLTTNPGRRVGQLSTVSLLALSMGANQAR
jgi:hypothetical protein